MNKGAFHQISNFRKLIKFLEEIYFWEISIFQHQFVFLFQISGVKRYMLSISDQAWACLYFLAIWQNSFHHLTKVIHPKIQKLVINMTHNLWVINLLILFLTFCKKAKTYKIDIQSSRLLATDRSIIFLDIYRFVPIWFPAPASDICPVVDDSYFFERPKSISRIVLKSF